MPVLINDFEEYDGKYKRIINCIEFDEEVIKNSGISIYGTNLEHPLMFNDEFKNIGNILYINKRYYENNKEEINKLIIDTLKNTTKSNIRLDSPDLINIKFLDALAENKGISNVKLDSTKKISKSQIEALLSENIKELNCAIDFDNNPEFLYEYIPKLNISNYPKTGRVGVADFVNNNVNLIIKESLTEEQLNQLRILFEKYPQEKVTINFSSKDQIKDVLETVIAKEIIIKDKKEYREEDYSLFESMSKNIFISVGDSEKTQTTHLKQRENILNEIVNEVKKHDFSPLEEYMYLYNVVKLFKEYKSEDKEEENKLISRHSAFTLFNEYMVCTGYAELLCELVNRLNNSNLKICDYSCTVFDEKNNEELGHRRCLVNIKDEKYDIDGIYISDPTWDHVIYNKRYLNEEGKIEIDYNESWSHYDFYNHFLMTKEEIVDEDVKYAYPDVTDVLFRNASNFSDEEIEQFSYLLSLSQEKMQKLNSDKKTLIDENNIEVKSLYQPLISGETIISSINNMYSRIFYGTKEQIENLVQQTVDINNEMHNSKFNKTNDKFNKDKFKKQ